MHYENASPAIYSNLLLKGLSSIQNRKRNWDGIASPTFFILSSSNLATNFWLIEIAKDCFLLLHASLTWTTLLQKPVVFRENNPVEGQFWFETARNLLDFVRICPTITILCRRKCVLAQSSVFAWNDLLRSARRYADIPAHRARSATLSETVTSVSQSAESVKRVPNFYSISELSKDVFPICEKYIILFATMPISTLNVIERCFERISVHRLQVLVAEDCVNANE